MKYIKILLFGLATLFSTMNAAAQDLPISFPTPEATELGKYGQIPVSYFNGLPDISIPLYTIQCKDLQVTISLSYHADGNKPDDHPGWVGLGWNLNAGGMITRIVNGTRDELNQNDFSGETGSGVGLSCQTGYYFRAADMDSIDWTSQSPLTSFLNKLSGFSSACDLYMDTQPDEFIFNFNGHSGSFYFVNENGQLKVKVKRKTGEIFKVETPDMEYFKFNLPVYPGYSGAVFQTYMTFTRFIITTTDGVKYEFGGNVNSVDNVDFTMNSTLASVSSWHLSKITSPNGNSIDFEYAPGGIEFVQKKSDYFYASVAASDSANSANQCIISRNDGNDGLSMCLNYPKYLQKITTSTGQIINFIASPSTELDYGDWNTPAVESWINSLFTKIVPHTGYDYNKILNQQYYMQLNRIEITNYKAVNFFYSNSTSQRLRLLGISETPIYADSIYPTSLSDPKNSYKYSFRYDNTFLPQYNSRLTDNWGYYNNKNYSSISFPDYSTMLYNFRTSNITYAKAEMLEQITYPTGGVSDFEYELNTYSKIVSGLEITTTPFTLIPDTGVAGGLRIKTITNYPNVNDLNNKIIKSFYYQNADGTSSGILSGIPRYYVSGRQHINYNISEWSGLTYYHSIANYTVNYYMYSQNLLLPLSSTDGNHITYSRVKEVDADGGYTVYSYTNHDEFPDELPVFIATNFDDKTLTDAFTSKELERGLLKSVEVYSANNQLVHITNYMYNDSTSRYNNYIKTINRYTLSGGTCSADFFRLSANKIYTFYPYLKTKIETNYDNNGANPVSITTNYTYNSYNLPQSITTTTSNPTAGNIKRNITYPSGYSSSIFQIMQQKNMLNYPVETTIYKGSNLVSSQLITYRQVIANNDTLYMPDKMYAIETSSPLGSFTPYNGVSMDSHYGTPNLVFVDYDSKGDIKETKDHAGISTSYLWSYNYQYPVAQIKNVTFSQVQSALGMSNVETQLSALAIPDTTKTNALRKQLPQAMVSTYTYQPHIGMTTETNPQGVITRYTYDTFGRLWLTRNDDKNFLSRYRYGYQNAPDNGEGGYTTPSAVISVSASSYTLGATGSATASASGGSGGYTYNWYLETSSGAVLSSSLNTTSTSFSFTCSQTGTLTVQCVVTDNQTGQTATSNKTITCNAALTASLSCALRFTQNATGTATVTATGGSGSYYYSWDFKDSSGTDLSINNHTTSTSFSFVCSEAGSMTLQCVVTDNQTGQSVTLTKPITVISNGGPPD